jgi:hypothetical protein
MSLFSSETGLARVLVAWLRSEGWTVYQEVHDGSSTCDVVATRGPLTWAIETKLQFGTSVIGQAAGWLWRANLVSVATPVSRPHWVLESYCKDNGIGWLHVRAMEANPVREQLDARLMRVRENSRSLRAFLHPAQLTGIEAGGNGGGFHTPFKDTCRKVAQMVADHPGLTIKQLIDKFGRGHYSSPTSARNGIYHWASKGKIPGVALRCDGKAATLHPLAEGEHVGVEARRERQAREARR